MLREVARASDFGGSNGGVEGREVRYRLVGECYVRGIIDGEGLAGGSEVEEFILC